MANVSGGSGNDTLMGTVDHDLITGLAGHDVLTGAAGDDTIYGGDGDDSFIGESGNDLFDGGTGSDQLLYYRETGTLGVVVNLQTGSATDTFGHIDRLISIERASGSTFGDTLIGGDALADQLFGREGNDSLNGGGGDDVLVGDAGNDTLAGGDGTDQLLYYRETGTRGVMINLATGVATDTFGHTDRFSSIERFYGSVFGDTLLGADASGDFLFGREGNDSLNGGGGDDALVGDAGNDTLAGGAGNDQLLYYRETGTRGVVVNLATGVATDTWGNTDSLSGFESIFGSVFGDTLIGGDTLADQLFGREGNDSLNGGGGDDVLVGDAGNDILAGGAGNDQLTYYRETGTRGVVVNLQTGTASDTWGNTDQISGIERIYATALADTLIGGDRSNDFLFGREGHDSIAGGGGDDTLIGDAGNDTITGGAGNDQVMYLLETGTRGVVVNLTTGVATDTWGSSDSLSGIEYVYGSVNGDSLTGTVGDDRLFGGAGNDTLDGVDGNDLVYTGAGNDLVHVGTQAAGARETVVISGPGVKTIVGTNSLGTRYGHHIVFEVNEAVTVNLATGIARSASMTTDFSQALFMLEVGGSAFGDHLIGGNPLHDYLEWFAGNQGNDTLDGGGGLHDTAIYDGEVNVGSFNYALGRLEFGTRGVVVNLATGVATDSFGYTDTLINIDDVRATNFADQLTGNAGENSFWGLAAADTIQGGEGSDSVLYGEDYLTGGTAGVVVDLAAGTARDGFGSIDQLVSIENVYATEMADSLTGNAADNRMFGYGGNDSLAGAAGNDVLLGGAGIDQIAGGDGDDELWGEQGADTLDGGAGDDDVRYFTSTSGVVVDLAAGTAQDGFGSTDRLISIEQVHGSEFGDLLRGSVLANRLIGDAGNDTLHGGAGNDTLSGGNGGDHYMMAAYDGYDLVNDLGQATGGADRIIFSDYLAEHATITRQNAADNTVVFNFGASADVVVVANALAVGDAGAIEFYQFSDGTVWDQAAMIAHLGQIGSGGTSAMGPINGTAGNDILNGTAGNDTINGLAGNDQLNGLDFADVMDGGAGNDTLSGGNANDTLLAGDGDDQLFGGNGHDRLIGGAGRDQLYGLIGNDLMSGDAGSDRLSGGDGFDFIDGGLGGDILSGGAGGDRFYHAGVASHSSDWVLDYTAPAGDVLHMGLAGATRDQFEVIFSTTNSMGGSVDVDDAFVIYKPTGQALWMLVDGAGQNQINVVISNVVYDLLA